VGERDLDAEFERIIAGWDDEAPDPQPRERAAATDQPGTEGAGDESADIVTDGAVADAPAPTGSAAPADPPTGEGQQADSRLDHTTPPAQPGNDTAGTTDTGGTTEPPGSTGGPGASGLLELPISPTTAHAWRGSAGPDDADAPHDTDDDHFAPPSEIDLPSAETDPMFWAIVGGLVGGPLLLLYVLFFDRDGSGWWVVTALTMVVVGFVLLVLRGGTERDPFDDGTRV